MNVNIYYKRKYGRFSYFGLRENKANQSQSKHVLSAVEWANFKAALKRLAGRNVAEKTKKMRILAPI